MADRLATPLGTKSEILVSKELLVAQDDIRSIGKSVDTLLWNSISRLWKPICLRPLKAQQLAVHDERARQGAQSSLLNMRPTPAQPSRALKQLNPVTVISQQ